ncbi:MAG TPA: hypothetical protein VES42_12055 [Pilimelia sp.]|nr:hypothetical protein [Pilimelia sp.]
MTSPKQAYAKSSEEAEKWLLAYADRIGLDKAWVGGDDWATTVRIACDKANGLETAGRTLDQELLDLRSAARREARREVVADYRAAMEQAAGQRDGDLGAILVQCFDRYIAGAALQFTYGAKMTKDRAEQLRGPWRQLNEDVDDYAADDVIHGFHAPKPQDKAAVGKGTVGDTLATRGWQANFLVHIGGRKFNAHVDLN